MFSRLLFWLVLDSNIQFGRLAPYIFGLAMGRMPHEVKQAKPIGDGVHDDTAAVAKVMGLKVK